MLQTIINCTWMESKSFFEQREVTEFDFFNCSFDFTGLFLFRFRCARRLFSEFSIKKDDGRLRSELYQNDKKTFEAVTQYDSYLSQDVAGILTWNGDFRSSFVQSAQKQSSKKNMFFNDDFFNFHKNSFEKFHFFRTLLGKIKFFAHKITSI